MPTDDPIDDICETFKTNASPEELVFWKGDILYSVASVLYYRFEELLNCYSDRPDIVGQLLHRVRDIYQNFSTMRTSHHAQMELWADMRKAHISFIAMTKIDSIAEACVGNNCTIEQDLNLKFIDLTSQKTAIRELTSICLSHFEQKIAKRIGTERASEPLQINPLAPSPPSVLNCFASTEFRSSSRSKRVMM